MVLTCERSAPEDDNHGWRVIRSNFGAQGGPRGAHGSQWGPAGSYGVPVAHPGVDPRGPWGPVPRDSLYSQFLKVLKSALES